MNIEDIKTIAHELISAKLNAHQEVAMEWAVHEIIMKQGSITGDGVEFYRLCAREHCYRIVKSVVDKYKGDETTEDKQQILLPGFDYLQVAYTVHRNDEIILVPIELLTDEEIDARALEFEKQAEGLNAHAEELRIYKLKRRASISIAS